MCSLILASRGSSPMPAPMSTAGSSAGTLSFRGFLACTEVDSRKLNSNESGDGGKGRRAFLLGFSSCGRRGPASKRCSASSSSTGACRIQSKSWHNCETATIRIPAGLYGRAWGASLLLPRLAAPPVRPGQREG